MGLGARAEFKGLIRDTLYHNGTRNLGLDIGIILQVPIFSA